MRVKIRKATLKDARAVARLIEELTKFEKRIDATFKTLDGKQLDEFEAYTKRAIRGGKGRFILVAEAEGKLIGYLYGEVRPRPRVFTIKQIGFINDLFVLPKYRNKGIGKMLTEKALKIFRKKKLKHVCLNAMSGNENALKAYEKLGFKEYRKELRKTI